MLERKSQVILYGPPGTGKTFWAERSAIDLASYSLAGKPFEELSDAERGEVEGGAESLGLIRICCFHPAYVTIREPAEHLLQEGACSKQ